MALSFTATRVKSITNRWSFRHSSKATDVSESRILGPIKTEQGHGVTTSSNTVNVVLFGETGVGKSSVINLIAQRTIAKVSSDVNGCTMESTKHDIEFDGRKFAIFDTIGLEEPQMGVNGYLKAIEKAYELITKLNHAGGVHLLLFCMRGGRITATTQSNYRLFCEILCGAEVPIALVFTGLEREVEMENWWRRNQKHIEGYGIKSKGHACVTAVLDNDTPGEDLKYNESRVVIRDLLKTCALENTAYSPDIISWFTRLGKDMMSLVEKRMSPKRKKILKVLVKRCKLDPDTAKKIADIMEKGEPNTQPAQPRTVGEANTPEPEAPSPVPKEEDGNSEDRVSDDEDHLDHQPLESGVVTVPPSSDTSLPEETTEAGQQVQSRSEVEESRSIVESNASGMQPETAGGGEDHLDHRPLESGVVTASPSPDASLLEKTAEVEQQVQGRSEESRSSAESNASGRQETTGEGEDYLDHRPLESGVATVSPSSDASLPKKQTEAGQQMQSGRQEEESGSNAESNASRRQEMTHTQEYVITPELVDAAGTSVPDRETPKSSEKPQNLNSVARTTSFVGETSKRPGEESIPSSATSTTSFCSAVENIEPLRADHSANVTSASSSSTVREGVEQPNEELILDGASRPRNSSTSGVVQADLSGTSLPPE